MRQLFARFRRLLRNEDGPTAVEYAVMLALILLVCLAAIRSFGSNTAQSLQNTANSLAS